MAKKKAAKKKAAPKKKAAKKKTAPKPKKEKKSGLSAQYPDGNERQAWEDEVGVNTELDESE